MGATLDPAPVRPLTSREISKVLCSIIGGAVAYDPWVAEFVPDVLSAITAPAPHDLHALNLHVTCDLRSASWAIALAATVSGLRGWCRPGDVDTALAWVVEHLDTVLATTLEQPAAPN